MLRRLPSKWREMMIRPLHVEMTALPKDSAFADFAGTAPEAGAENAITFSLPDLHVPFVSFHGAMRSYFEPELLPGGAGTIEDVSEKLGLSRRTLQPKRAEENTTFQKQRNSTREILAIHDIRNTDMSTNDMVYLPGYAELNSFLRAFAVWTGKSITEYRKGLEEEARAQG